MGLLLQSKSLLSKKFCFSQNFETRSILHINFYIMGHPFNMYTNISMYTEARWSWVEVGAQFSNTRIQCIQTLVTTHIMKAL